MIKKNLGSINISLDSASPEVYKKVKGVDCYQRVINNLEKYCSINPSNINLKYIIFDANNDISEIKKFLFLAKKLNVERVEFSFDFREVNSHTVSQKSKTAAAFFAFLAESLRIDYNPFFIVPELLSEVREILNNEFH